MNEDLQKQLAEMLAKLMDATQNAATWTGNQIPSLVQEKIAYGRATHLLMVVLMLAMMTGAYRLFRYGRDLDWDVDRHNEIIPATMAAALVGALGSLGLWYHAQWALLAWIAPRLYIVEWLRTLIK